MVKVELLVYDLSRGMAISMSQAILGQRIDGIWHTGVQVFSQEFYYGGGIQSSPIGAFASGSGMWPVRTVDMGESGKTLYELQQFLQSIRSRFTESTYDLIRNNCNNFSNEVCIFLTGKPIPSYIIDLPNIVFSTPFGAMLRPMLENMQQSIQQQRSTLDPFGSLANQSNSNFSSASECVPTSNTTSTSCFEGNLSEQIRTNILQSNVVRKVDLEEFPLTSSEVASADIIGKKLLQLSDESGVPGTLLSPSEKSEVEAIIKVLKDNSGKDHISKSSFELLTSIIKRSPKAEMSCLFLLRLMALHDHLEYGDIVTVEFVLDRLSKGPSAFASVSSMVMALCFVANLISHEPGARVVFSPQLQESEVGSDNSDDRASKVLDIAMSALSHDRPEVRQMGSALAYNYSLCCTPSLGKASNDVKNSNNSNNSNNSTPKPWEWKAARGEGEEDMNPQAVQLLCGTLESLASESDPAARKRKLATACRVVRTFGLTAGALARDLGFMEVITMLHEKLEGDGNNSQTHDYEMGILHELAVSMA